MSGELGLDGVDEDEAEMWAVCAHEAGHAVGAMAHGLDTAQLRARVHLPLLGLGRVDSSGEMYVHGIDTRELDDLDLDQIHGLQVCSLGGRVAEIKFRTEQLGQPMAFAMARTIPGCRTDESIMQRYRDYTSKALTVGQAEAKAEDALDTYEDRWLDLVERMEGADGRLGGGFFDWAATVEV